MKLTEGRLGKGELSPSPEAASGSYSQLPNGVSNQLAVVAMVGVCLDVQMTLAFGIMAKGCLDIWIMES